MPRIVWSGALVVVLGACGHQEAPQAAASTPAPAPAEPPQSTAQTPPGDAAPTGEGRPLTGTVSGLRSTRSDLQGLITALDGEVRDDTAFVALPADTLFAFDDDRLGADAQPVLAQLHELVSQTEGTVQLIGHTDDVGADDYNLALSKRRAQAVADWLQQQGVEASRLSISGRGAEAPVAENRDSDGRDQPEGRARNRRVEVQVPVGS